jgi:Putative peptidoglycan binding domain
MKSLHAFRAVAAATLTALLPITARAGFGPHMGGFGGGHMGGFGGTGSHHSMGGAVRGGSHVFMGNRFGHDGRFFNNHRFVHNDHFFDHRFDHGRFFHDHDRFFHHHRNIFVFDFVSFGFPWWYPYPYYYGYPYGYPYDYAYSDPAGYDYQYWNDLAMSVQSELARRGYYSGSLDGVIGPNSRRAIRAFQAAQGLPVTGIIDAKLLKALRISYRTA